MKLPKKNIEVKTSDMPKHKLAFTVHPHCSEPETTGFLSLEVTVISKYASPRTPTLILSIVVKDNRDTELERHSLEQQLQSFFLHKFLSRAKLQRMSPRDKIVIDIHAQIVCRPHPEDYVVVETDHT